MMKKFWDSLLKLFFGSTCIHCEENNDSNNTFFCQKCLLEIALFFEESMQKSKEDRMFLFPLKGAARSFYKNAFHDLENLPLLASFATMALLKKDFWKIPLNLHVPKRAFSSLKFVEREIKKIYPTPEEKENSEKCILYFTMTAKSFYAFESKQGIKHLVFFLET